MVVASNCGNAAFQKKPNTLMTSTSHQNPLPKNTPQKVTTASRLANRMMAIRCPVWSAIQPQTFGAITLLAMRTAISSPISATPRPADFRYRLQ
jgi:hypothetical protein